MSVQLLETSELPISLWDPSVEHGRAGVPKGRLHLPDRLAMAYRQALEELGLTEAACDIADREPGPIGESGASGANSHFAKRFSGSCGRVQVFCLDPHLAFKSTRNALLTKFCGGTVRLLDIPLGAGAGAISLLSAIAQMRAEDPPVLPKIDLDVQVVGGDENPHAIAIAERMFAILGPWWLDQGINVSLTSRQWDVLSDESTADLIELWRSGVENGVSPAVVVANFSGFLASPVEEGHTRKMIDEAESCLRQVFACISKIGAPTFWIEPATNPAIKHCLPRLRTQVLAKFKRVKPVLDETPKTAALMRDPIVAEGEFVTRTTGIHVARA